MSIIARKIYITIAVILTSILAIALASHVSLDNEPDNEGLEENKINEINDEFAVERGQDCVTIFYNETINVYGNVTRTRDIYGNCFNPTNRSYYTCVVGAEEYQSYEVINKTTHQKSRNECKNKRNLIVSF